MFLSAYNNGPRGAPQTPSFFPSVKWNDRKAHGQIQKSREGFGMVYSPFPFFDQFLSLPGTHMGTYTWKAPLRQLSQTPLLPVPLYLITFLFCQWLLCFYENFSNYHSLLRLKWCKIDLIHGTKFTSCCRKEVIDRIVKH